MIVTQLSMRKNNNKAPHGVLLFSSTQQKMLCKKVTDTRQK